MCKGNTQICKAQSDMKVHRVTCGGKRRVQGGQKCLFLKKIELVFESSLENESVLAYEEWKASL